jgi:hypothetical protein
MTDHVKTPENLERRLDEALAESFPASDPPFFVGAGNMPGAKARLPKPRGEFGQDYGQSVQGTNWRLWREVG